MQATAEYLPWLYGVLASVEADDLLLPTEPSECRFEWVRIGLRCG